MKTSKVTTSSIAASLYDIFSRRRKSDVTAGHRALNANDVIGMQTISATKSTNYIVKKQPVHSSTSPEIPVIVIEHDDNDDDSKGQGSVDVTTGDQSSPVTFNLPHDLATADEDEIEMGDSGSSWKPQLCKRKSSSLECLTDVKKEDEDWLSTAQDDGRLVKKRPLSRAPPFGVMGFPCMGYPPSVTTSKHWEGFASKSSSTTSLLGKSSSSVNLSSSREGRNSVYSVESALMMAIRPVSETILEKSDVSSSVSDQAERSASSVTSACGGGGSKKSHHSSHSSRGNGAVPRIPLKRREGLYAEEAALMQQRLKERSASVSSVQYFICPSPLLHLSASELFLQADDDGRSSMTSSMTSLSFLSGASCSSGASDSSNDSGVGEVGDKNRRSVSFSGSDVSAAKDFRPRKSYRRGLSENSRRDRFDDAADPESDARSTVSCSVYTIGGNLGRPRPRRCSAVRSLLTPHVPHATPGSGRPRSESCSDLSPHLLCGGSGSSTIPLRCSRGRSVSCLSLNSLGSDPECDEGVLFTVRFYNRIGKKVDGSDALSNLSHVYHLYKGMLLLTDILESKITFLASNGRAVKTFLAEAGSQPWNSCVTNKGHVAVTLRRQSCVTVWSGNGSLVREFGHDVLQCPTGLACDQKGRFVVTDEQTNRVAIFNEAGKFVRYLCHKADLARKEGPEELGEQAARDSSSQRLGGEEGGHHNDENNNNKNEDNTTDMRNCRTKKPQRRRRAGDGDFGSSVGEPESDETEKEEEAPVFQFSLPRYVWVTRRGKILVSDSGSHSVKVFSEDGVFLRSIGTHGTGDGQLKVPYGVCCDQEENVFIADHYNDRVSVFTIDGEFVQHVLTAAAGLSRPKSLAIRCGTQERKLYVAHGGLRSTEVAIYRLFTGKPQTQQAVTFKCDI